MRITCPLCGPRPLEEFTYRGDAAPQRPAADAPMENWVDYVYLRKNPKGMHREYWRHSQGCGGWLLVERDTHSHVISQVAEARSTEDARP